MKNLKELGSPDLKEILTLVPYEFLLAAYYGFKAGMIHKSYTPNSWRNIKLTKEFEDKNLKSYIGHIKQSSSDDIYDKDTSFPHVIFEAARACMHVTYNMNKLGYRNVIENYDSGSSFHGKPNC